MKIRHDVDATTLKRTKAKAAAVTLSLLVLAGAASTATSTANVALKTRHDGGGCCMK